MADILVIPSWWDWDIFLNGTSFLVIIWLAFNREHCILKLTIYVVFEISVWLFTLTPEEFLEVVEYVYLNYMPHSPFVMLLGMFVVIVTIYAIAHWTAVKKG